MSDFKRVIAADRDRTAPLPEIQLWETTLRDALNTISTGKARGLNSGHTCNSTARAKQASDAMRDDLAWLASDDYFIGSFLWICEILGISAQYIRANIASYTCEGQPRMKRPTTVRMKIGMGPPTKVVAPYKAVKKRALAGFCAVVLCLAAAGCGQEPRDRTIGGVPQGEEPREPIPTSTMPLTKTNSQTPRMS